MRFRNQFLFYVLILFLFNSQILYSQSFEKILSIYEKKEENDSKALPYVRLYINKAKKERSFQELALGYKDAVFYTKNIDEKIKFSDSCISAAIKSQNDDLISTAFVLKGSVFYYNFKKYKPALNEYLKAYKYSKNSKDLYLRYKVIYHIGVVKSYLGYYTEALVHFKNCISYFENKTKLNLSPDDLFNNTKGYLNSLHQAIVCYRNIGSCKAADSLIRVGLSATGDSKDYELEKAYFLKCRGVLNYHQKKYKESIIDLDNGLPIIIKNKDFAWESVCYFYKGKSYLAKGEEKKAVQNFLKVDYIFHQNNFILPELRENYELLINDARKKGDTKQELYYTKSLLKADSIINKDFVYLSSRIHREYDSRNLEDAKSSLEGQNSLVKSLTIVLFSIIILLATVLYFRNKKQNEIKLKYNELRKKLDQRNAIISFENTNKPPASKSSPSKEFVDEILSRLERFEKENEFIEKGITLNKLAVKFGTNSSYLSQVVNEKRGVNFNKYLAELRINFITKKLYEDKRYLNYKIESLAEECGIASRQNFSDLFLEINGIRPADFIRQRRLELEKQADS